MTRPNMNFVENILETKSYDTALKFKMLQPKDWKLFLGKFLFQRYLKVIADLFIIWEATLGLPHPLSYAEYIDIKDQVYEHVFNKLRKQVDLHPPQSLSSKRSPAYSRISPHVESFNAENQASADNQGNKKPNSSKSSRHRQTYKSTVPNLPESFSFPVVNAYAAPDSMSTASQSEYEDMTYYDGKSQLDPHDLLSPEEELEALGMGRPKKARSLSGVPNTSVIDRRLRAANAKIRPKF